MATLTEMARALGEAIARTTEYQALRTALTSADDDRELVELRNVMERLEGQIAEAVRAGQEPSDDVKQDYESTFNRLQTNAAYQRVAVARTNFDKVLTRVHDTISAGMESAADSKIILPT